MEQKQKQGFRLLSWRTAAIVWVIGGIGAIVWLFASMTDDPDAGLPLGIDSEQAYLTLYQRLIASAVAPEAIEYVSILFSVSPAAGVAFTSDAELEEWYITVESWPKDAVAALNAADWFTTDAAGHLETLGQPTWIIHEYRRILPDAGALLVEADIARLNQDRLID